MRNSRYWIELRHKGRRYQRSLRTKDSATAHLLAAEFVRQVERDALPGCDDKDPLKLMEDYLADKVRKGCCASHVASLRHRLEYMLRGASALKAVNSGWIRRRLAALRGKHGAASPRNQNCYRTAVNGLFRFLIRQGLALNHHNPVEAIEPAPVPRDYYRRALTVEEVERLLAVAPAYRRAAYVVALCTGMRRGELSGLRWEEVNLDEGRIVLKAGRTKARRAATIPLNERATQELRALKESGTGAPTALVWDCGFPIARTVNSDFARAGIPKETAEGRVDLHSLRVTFCSRLAEQGVPLQVAQQLLRHSTPALTSNVYTRVNSDVKRSAVEGIMPALVSQPATQPEEERVRCDECAELVLALAKRCRFCGAARNQESSTLRVLTREEGVA